ncbi:unnamed protein product [Lampetra planeri]
MSAQVACEAAPLCVISARSPRGPRETEGMKLRGGQHTWRVFSHAALAPADFIWTAGKNKMWRRRKEGGREEKMIVSRKQRAFPTSDAQVCPIIRSDRNAPACRELLRTILNARIYQLVKTVSGPIDVGASRPGSGARAAGARVLRRGQGSAWLGLMETLSVGEIGLRADSISTIGTRQPAPETSSKTPRIACHCCAHQLIVNSLLTREKFSRSCCRIRYSVSPYVQTWESNAK